MILSPKMMRALSAYWERKFNTLPETGVDVDKLLAVPSPETLYDSENVLTVLHNVRCGLLGLGIGEESLKPYTRYGFAPIAYFFSKSQSGKLSLTELDELLDEVKLCNDNGAISRRPYLLFRKATALIRSYCKKGFLDNADSTTRRGNKHDLSSEFEDLLKLYSDKICDYRSLSENTLKSRCSLIRGLLAQMEQMEVTTVEGISHRTINSGITAIAQKYCVGTKSWVDVYRQFFRFLNEIGVTADDFSLAIPDTLPRKRVIRSGFTQDEINRLLNAVNKDSLNGKRDYALMVIVAKTGLRAVDIINLKFGSVDWRSNEIRIVQQKTGNTLNIPLESEVGNAIADYILNSRPHSESEYIFVKRFDPLKRIGHQTPCAAIKKYIKLTGIDAEKTSKRGIHSFRRSFGLNLLEASVPIDMINELLGHADMNSSRSYLAIDENGLRNCSLGLILSENGGASNAV